MARRHPQRCHAELVCRIHAGALSKQQIDDFLILVVGSPLERRGAIASALIDVDVLAYQRACRGQVVFPDGLDQPGVARSGPKRCSREHEHDEASAEVSGTHDEAPSPEAVTIPAHVSLVHRSSQTR
jgi:hypothetical protein